MNSIEELKREFESKIKTITELKVIKGDRNVQNLINKTILNEIKSLDLILEKLEDEKNRKIKLLKEAEDLKEKTIKLRDLLPSNDGSTTLPNVSTVPQSEDQPKKRTPNYDYDDDVEYIPDCTYDFTNLPKKCDLKISATNLIVSEIRHITPQEFSKLSKYMIGRMTIDKINDTIDTLNQVCTSKYDIISMHKSKQSDKIRNLIREYKDQENKDTTGYNFIIDNDIKQYSALKLDKSLFSIITILRHCNRIKEVRGNNLVRYVFV